MQRERLNKTELINIVGCLYSPLQAKHPHILPYVGVGGSVARPRSQTFGDVDIIVYLLPGSNKIAYPQLDAYYEVVANICRGTPFASLFEVRNQLFEREYFILLAELYSSLTIPGFKPTRFFTTIQGFSSTRG